MAQLITLNNIDPSALTTISGPKVTAIAYSGNDTATAVSGGQTITLTGAGFQNGATVYVDGTAVSVVTVASSTVISFTAPAKSAGGYPLYVVNADGGTATFPPGIQYSGTPTWTTNSGSLGTVYETQAIDIALSAVSDSAVTYTVATGVLPAGTTLDANTGNISGTANLVNASTTYNFAVDAVDAENQDTRRNFSVTVDPDVVTFNTPADNSTYTGLVGDPAIVSLNATSILGKTITYSSDSLPDGLAISGNLISGNYTTAANSVSVITATAVDTNRTDNITLNWAVENPPPTTGQAEYITPGTYSWTAPAGITSVCVVCVGGGGAGFSSSTSSLQASGGGGGLGWKNNITVVPGQSYTVVVGLGGRQASLGGAITNAQDSYFIQANDNAYATGKGGISGTSQTGGIGGVHYGDGGGNGGNGVARNSANGAGGGGAGGYSGNGASGINTGSGQGVAAPTGSGAGGAGGTNGNGGGGVGIYGRGADGGPWGEGGSGGGNGGFYGSSGAYGGGGSTHYNIYYAPPADGAVRIIWGPGRAFPATNTGDL